MKKILVYPMLLVVLGVLIGGLAIYSILGPGPGPNIRTGTIATGSAPVKKPCAPDEQNCAPGTRVTKPEPAVASPRNSDNF